MRHLVSLVLAWVVTAGNTAASTEERTDEQSLATAEFLAHKALFQDSTIRVGDTPVWSLTDHGVNVSVVVGPEGLILIDTGTHRGYAEKALAKLRAVTDKPIRAIIYTHHHLDHVNGAGYFVDPQAVATGEVEVVASANLVEEMSDENVMLAPIMGLRSSYMYGFGLEGEEARLNYVGCCGDLTGSTIEHQTSFIPPTVEVADQLELNIAGVEVQLFRTGGEAGSHIVAWIPEYRVMFAGDEVQGPTFPNLHSMRGTRMRDANAWVDGIDRIRALRPQHLVFGHGNPVSGEGEIERILATYRDAIQYAHDQSIRFINKGYTPVELGAKLNQLPDYLRFEPWTGEHYGNLPTAARSYYTGYVSWFSGDAVDLQPTPRPECSARVIALMGGRDAVLKAAADALAGQQHQFAAELATLLIAHDNSDTDARSVKARAFRYLGYRETNTNWRNFYLLGAMELEGRLVHERQAAHLNNPENLAGLPGDQLVALLRYRVDAERAGDTRISLDLRLTDTNELFTLALRNSVLEIEPVIPVRAPVQIDISRAALAELVAGQSSLDTLLQAQRASLSGERVEALRFFSLFDVGGVPRPLVVR